MTHRPLIALTFALLALGGAAAAQDLAEGEALYATFCATCHGPGAQGDGPTAEIMTIAPTDLTRLAAVNEGSFPHARVVMQIDGRGLIAAHGVPMPLFGPFFQGEDAALKTDAGQPILTSRPIVDLVSYLQSIQVTE
jgi:mono/diheme cytochrome c family protein